MVEPERGAAPPFPAPISAPARLLGFAGLLPQLFALLLIASGIDGALGALMAFTYAVVILSFIGGAWWGFAMGRGADQPMLAAVAVTPTLVAFVLVLSRLLGMDADWALVLIGCAVMLTLLIDRAFVRLGHAPPGWMGLRVPLSIALAALTITAGALAPSEISIVYSN